MKKISKNKWILGGIVAFASIALISTGFAAWQIGTQMKETSVVASTSVSGVNYNTVLLTVSLDDNKITLGDNTTSTTGGVVSADSDDQDFKISGTLRLEVSPSYLKANTIKSVDVSFGSGDSYVLNTVGTLDSSSNNATGFHSEDSLTYFDLVSSSLTFPTLNDDGSISDTSTGWAKKDNNGSNYVYTYSISSESNFFQWGSYFEYGTNSGEYDSVTAYYNSKISTAVSNYESTDKTYSSASTEKKAELVAAKQAALASNVETELNTMSSKYEGKSIQLHFALQSEAASSNS